MVVLVGVGSKRALYGPSITKDAAPECAEANAGFFGPIRKNHSFALKCKVVAISSVATLLFWSGPTNIGWFVVPVWINTIKRVLIGWSGANGIKECLKRTMPFGTYSYTPSTVKWVACLAFIVASIKHRAPSAIFFCFFSWPIVPMLCMKLFSTFCGPLCLKAPTALCMSIFQTFCGDRGFIAALTFTKPVFITRLDIWRFIDRCQYGQSSKCLIG